MQLNKSNKCFGDLERMPTEIEISFDSNTLYELHTHTHSTKYTMQIKLNKANETKKELKFYEFVKLIRQLKLVKLNKLSANA